MKSSALEEKVIALVEPVIKDMGFALVQLRIYADGPSETLQILAEDPQTFNLGVDDCAKISRSISAVLDVEDPIKGAYRLEVSSPGIDRPLTRVEDFERFKGFDAKVEVNPPINERKRFRGPLLGEENGIIKMEIDGETVEIPFERVHKAKLVLTDALINATKKDVTDKNEH